MNNNLNLVNNIGRSYNLTGEQFNLLTSQFANDTRDQSIIENDIKNICEFYKFKNNLDQNLKKATPLENGKNYYVTTFDQNSNMYLQPVSINITNSETNEVLVDNSANEADILENIYYSNNTSDNVTLLSWKEIERLIPKISDRLTSPSDYAKCQGVEIVSNISPWNLRTPISLSAGSSFIVVLDGNLAFSHVFDTTVGVRPVIWIEL